MMKWMMIVMLCCATIVAADEADDTINLLVQVLKDTNDPAAQADMLRGLNAAMEGKKSAKMPAGWAELYAKLSKSPNDEVKKQAAKLAALFGDVGTLDEMKKIAADAKKPAAERIKALETLINKGDAAVVPLLQSLLADKAVCEVALKGLAGFDDARTPALILDHYAGFDLSSRRAAVNTLSFKLVYAKELVKAVQSNKIPKGDMTAYTVRQLRTLGDKEIEAWTMQNWGAARTTPDEKLNDIEKYKKILTPELIAKADISAGRALFAKTCQQCHLLYGEGGKVGPDLTGSNRADLDYFLQNVIDPSAIISKEYQVTNIWTKDGDVYSGIVTREDDKVVTFVTESDTINVERADIQDVRKSELSMMPEGLIAPLSEKDLANLVAYLRMPEQVPLPK